MLIKSLHLENFQNISATDILFEDGITVFNGPNASGKSGVLAAIGFCLGEMRRGDSWEDYVQSGKDYFLIEMTVQFEKLMTFTYRGDIKSPTISIMSKHINYDGKDYYNSECKTFLDTMLDMDMINNIIFTMQDSPSITKLRPLERRDIFKKIFNSDFTDSINDIRNDMSISRTTQATLQAEIDTLTKKTYVFNRLEIQDPAVLVSLLEKKERLLRVQEENQKAKLASEQYGQHEAQRERLIAEHLRVKSTNERDSARMFSLAQEQDQLKIVASNIVEANRVRVQDVVKLQAQKIEAEGRIAKLRERVTIIDSDLDRVAITLHAVRAQLAQSSLHLETHRAGSCPTCGEVCKSDNVPALEEEVNKWRQREEEITLAIGDLGDQKDVLLDSINTATTHVATLAESIRKLEWDISSTTQERDRKLKVGEELTEKIRELTQVRGEQSHTLSLLADQIQKEKDWLNTHTKNYILVDSSGELAEIDNQIALYNETIAINAERERQNTNLAAEKTQDEVLIRGKAESKDAEQKKEIELDTTKTIFEVMLPNYVNSKACILCEKYMNSFLSMTKDSFQVRLTPTKKGISFLYQPRPECGFINAKQASGFESAILTLAFKAAIAYAYKSDLFVLDEPDKDADSESSVRFFETLLSINSGFKQMIVITHRSNAVSFLQDNGATVYEVEDGTFVRRD